MAFASHASFQVGQGFFVVACQPRQHGTRLQAGFQLTSFHSLLVEVYVGKFCIVRSSLDLSKGYCTCILSTGNLRARLRSIGDYFSWRFYGDQQKLRARCWSGCCSNSWERLKQGSGTFDSSMAPTMLFTQSDQGSVESMRLKGTLISLRPSRAASKRLTVGGTSHTSHQNASRTKSSLTLDLSFLSGGEDAFNSEESGCETPKSEEHRIPDVDIDFCPPAPKKPRSMRRSALICAIECESSDVVSKANLGLQVSSCYLY